MVLNFLLAQIAILYTYYGRRTQNLSFPECHLSELTHFHLDGSVSIDRKFRPESLSLDQVSAGEFGAPIVYHIQSSGVALIIGDVITVKFASINHIASVHEIIKDLSSPLIYNEMNN